MNWPGHFNRSFAPTRAATVLIIFVAVSGFAQGSRADYERAASLSRRFAGQVFRDKILSRGRTKEPSVLFNDFYGAPPDIAPLAEYRGLVLPKTK